MTRSVFISRCLRINGDNFKESRNYKTATIAKTCDFMVLKQQNGDRERNKNQRNTRQNGFISNKRDDQVSFSRQGNGNGKRF